jgi:soluble lytic murein transglycosylase-like protein
MFAGETVGIDKAGMSALRDIQVKEASKLPSTVKPIVNSYLKDIVSTKGKMDGDAYQRLRSQLNSQSKSMRVSDPFTAEVLRNIRVVLDEAANKSLPKAKSGALKNLNNQYRNYKSLVKSVSNASENAVEGVVSPAKLLQVLEAGNKTKTQAGYGDLYELANSGRLVLPSSVPNSGTAQREFAKRILTAGGAPVAVGGATYGITGDPQASAIAAAGSIASPKIAQTLLNSKAAQSYFTKGIPGLSNVPAGVGSALNRGAAISAGGMPSGAMNERRGVQEQPAPEYTPAQPVELTRPQSSLFQRVIQQESGGKQFDSKGRPLRSNKGAVGIAQIMPKTAPEAAQIAGLPWDEKRYLTDPEYNAALGEAYLNKKLEEFGGNEALALMAYNWGAGNVRAWLKRGADPRKVPAETRNYLTKILGEA